MKRIFVFVFALCLLSIPLAQAIGVSPSKVSLDNLAKGEVIESFGYISDIDNRLIIGTPIGEIASWISIDNKTLLNAPKEERVKVPFSISIPTDIPNGEYTGSIEFSTKPIDTENSVSIKTIVPLNIRLTVVGEEIRSFSIEQISVSNVEEDSAFHIFTTINNKGNVIAIPELIGMSVEDIEKNVIFEKEIAFNEGVPPHKKGIVLSEFANTLQAGKYTVICYIKDKGQIVFFESIDVEVHEKGFFAKEATLKNILIPLFISNDEMLKIQAVTMNNGELPIQAKFVGEIYLNGKLIGISESDSFTINPNDEKELVAFFKPEKKGDYNIVGKVIYDGKETKSQEEMFSVKENFFKESIFIGIFATIIISAGILAQVLRRKKE